MTGTSVDLAVRLVRQAVHQDSKKNYTEAARCYREAILILQQLKTSRTSSCRRMQNFLNTKLVQYEERLRIIEHHLLQKSDLSKFFKELQSCHFDDCGSSVSSDTKHLYKNPLLVKALDLIRRGRKEDERSNYRAAGTCYEAGLSSLLDILNKGVLTEKQAETARVKCLLYHERLETIRGYLESGERGSISYKVQFSGGEESLDSDCDSPVPPTETEEILQMEEVRSCSSRVGSTHSLYERRHSSSKSLDTSESLHSLYPVCQIKHSPSRLSVRSGEVPLANIASEFSESIMSIASRKSSTEHGTSSMTNLEKISVLEISTDDTTEEPELAVLNDQCDDSKSEGSDSGYSDPSPDGTVRDSMDMTDHRKSPFSDLSEHDVEISDKSCGEVIPRVIIVNESIEHREFSTPITPRQTGRQTSRFQNAHKDILTSQVSQDQLLVYDEVDAPVKRDTRSRLAPPKKEVTISTAADVYTPRRAHRERIPARATAREPQGEHGDMNKGCYYLMAALDFCWCL